MSIEFDASREIQAGHLTLQKSPTTTLSVNTRQRNLQCFSYSIAPEDLPWGSSELVADCLALGTSY